MIRGIFNRLKKMRRQKSLILMYHQVCDRRDDPWELAVHPNHFEAQLGYLKKHFEVVSVDELVANVTKRKMKKRIALTFDDGFRDNYTNAAPLLDWFEIPATFYVATSPAQEQAAYWWDALQQIIFHTVVLPQELDIIINGDRVRFRFISEAVLSSRVANQIRAWNCNLPIPNERISLFMLLWSRIKPVSYREQNRILKEIAQWAGSPLSPLNDAALMTVREIQTLSRHPLFTIGAHSVHHAALPAQRPDEQAFEVKGSKGRIEEWLGKSVTGFAYPFGSYDTMSRTILKEAGFSYGVSTECKAVTAEDDTFAMPRVQVKNWSVYEFAARINEMIYD